MPFMVYALAVISSLVVLSTLTDHDIALFHNPYSVL
jgi:hypothetical protein